MYVNYYMIVIHFVRNNLIEKENTFCRYMFRVSKCKCNLISLNNFDSIKMFIVKKCLLYMILICVRTVFITVYRIFFFHLYEIILPYKFNRHTNILYVHLFSIYIVRAFSVPISYIYTYNRLVYLCCNISNMNLLRLCNQDNNFINQ